VLLEHQKPSLFGLQIDQLACPINPLRIGYDPQQIKLPRVFKMDAPAVDATVVRARLVVKGRASTPAIVWQTTSRQKASRRSDGTLAVVTNLLLRANSLAGALCGRTTSGFKVTLRPRL
jgi:hypothetical protein